MPLLPVFGEQCRFALNPSSPLERRHAMQALFTNPTLFLKSVGITARSLLLGCAIDSRVTERCAKKTITKFVANIFRQFGLHSANNVDEP
jgi:hypothetical protein